MCTHTPALSFLIHQIFRKHFSKKQVILIFQKAVVSFIECKHFQFNLKVIKQRGLKTKFLNGLKSCLPFPSKEQQTA